MVVSSRLSPFIASSADLRGRTVRGDLILVFLADFDLTSQL